MYDVAIIGGGPAGATLARLLGAQYRVLLADRRDLLRPPDFARPGKCCGGLLAPAAQRQLAAMGLELPRAVLVPPQPEAVRLLDIDNGIVRDLPRDYRNVDRERFDRWLLAQVPAGVTVRGETVLCDCAATAEGMTLSLKSGGRRYTERARVLVGADGAASLVRRRLFPRRPPSRTYLAVQEWYELPSSPQPRFSAVFDRALSDFYGWTITKDGLLLIGGALAPHDEPARKFARLQEDLRRHGFCWGRRVKREGALIVRPHPRDICPGQGAALLVGEAAGWISPASAEGMSYAFRSAQALAQSLLAGLDGADARYRQAAAPLYRAVCAQWLRGAAASSPLLRRIALEVGRPGTPALDDGARARVETPAY